MTLRAFSSFFTEDNENIMARNRNKRGIRYFLPYVQ